MAISSFRLSFATAPINMVHLGFSMLSDIPQIFSAFLEIPTALPGLGMTEKSKRYCFFSTLPDNLTVKIQISGI